jgi:hypothetical protein
MDSSVGTRGVFSVLSNTMMYLPPVCTVVRGFVDLRARLPPASAGNAGCLQLDRVYKIPARLRPAVSVFRDYDAGLPVFGIFSAVTMFPYAAGFSRTITMHPDPVSICHGGVPPGLYDTTLRSPRLEVKQLTLPEV